VDNIFPAYAEEGLVSSNMQKLIYYAATSPEKWDRIGEYLASRVGRDLNRTYPRYGFVKIGMEAMDQLLMTCASQHLNLYVESYLKTVQKLLECTEPEMQIRASESFLQFAQKEEDVPAYHRRYDFFISKFSQMCHYETNDPVVTTQIRVSGLQGIGGVVRKIESEDLAENIWSPIHMDKIIPSLLYNIQIGDYKVGGGRSQTPDLANLSEHDTKSALQIAEDTFRKLMGRAGFLAIKAVMRPILQHLDIHKMWNPPDFAEHTFQMVMFSIQQQVNYIIIEMLMQHLDKRAEDTKVRVGIATVLSRIFSSRAVDASVGPSVLETINALLTHLRTSVEQANVRRESDPDAQRYHEALLTALGEYSSSLPNFQMIEIMMFILGKAPQSLTESQMDQQSALDSELQHMLLKALLTVAEKFVPVQFSTTFSLTFLEPLLAKLHSQDPDAKMLVLRIFQTLIDRKGNLDKLECPSVEPRADLVAQKPNFNKQDNAFFVKHGEKIYREMISVLKSEPVSVEFLEQYHTTTSLLLLECNSDENIRYQMDMIHEIQELAFNKNSLRLSNANKFALHSTCISQLSMLSFVVRLPDIFEYKDRLVSMRRSLVPHLLPPLEEEYSPDIDPVENLEQSLIDLEPVKAALKDCGRYSDKTGVAGARSSLQSSRANSPRHSPRNSWMESVHSVQRRPSSVSVSSVTVDVDSCASSPGIIRRPPAVEVGFAEMKRALAEPSVKDRELEEAAKRQLHDKFLTATFSELCSLTLSSKPPESLYQCIAEIYERQAHTGINSSAYSLGGEANSQSSRKSSLSVDTTDLMSPVKPILKKPLYEEYFPELFMY